MSFPLLDVAGLGLNLYGTIAAGEEAHHRFRAMRSAARRLQQQQNAEFNQARFGIREAQQAWENDPARATIRRLWEQRLANPDVISPEQLSVMRQTALSNAATGSEGAINALREQQQRAGLGSSPMALGAEAGLRSQ